MTPDDEDNFWSSPFVMMLIVLLNAFLSGLHTGVLLSSVSIMPGISGMMVTFHASVAIWLAIEAIRKARASDQRVSAQ